MAVETCCVSVLVPAYNSAATLPRAVRSALSQDLPDIEVVIIDDGSDDRTDVVARALAAGDARVRQITLPRNRGKAVAMNTGVAAARGRWIAVLDADDWYAPNRLSTLISLAEQRRVELVADNQFHYDDGAGAGYANSVSGAARRVPIGQGCVHSGKRSVLGLQFRHAQAGRSR